MIGANVSSTFFSVLRVQPQQGRAFLPQDEQPGGIRAAMLSHAGWMRHFSQDPAIVGRTITLDGVDHAVVGVLPPDFSLFDADVWVAGFDPALLNSRVVHGMGAMGRLAAHVPSEQARVELNTVGRRLATAYPDTNTGWTFRTMPLQEAWLGSYRSTALFLLGAVAMVMLIACANLASLLLERALARDREVTIRLALGARRRSILQEMLVESLLLAVARWCCGGARRLVVARLRGDADSRQHTHTDSGRGQRHPPRPAHARRRAGHVRRHGSGVRAGACRANGTGRRARGAA